MKTFLLPLLRVSTTLVLTILFCYIASIHFDEQEVALVLIKMANSEVVNDLSSQIMLYCISFVHHV